ncbi:DNA cross-link repair protein PSO2/SNM1 [Naganishia albida]|nr:DNA cross-link repair protein PSO2/SNM1 [Naganishia albida]
MASVDNVENLVSNGLLQSPIEALREQKIPSTEGDQSVECRPGIPPDVTLSMTQTSELEQALEEEEGEWNEGDEEGMGMEDLDINDDEEAVLAGMKKPSVDANEQEDPAVEGEKRKRKGKQKASLVENCSSEIIALDDFDQGDDADDDSLGGREDVDDFDVDDEECPVRGRTSVGMRGDPKRSHVTQCPGTDSADINPKPSKGQQPISSFCKPGQPLTIKSERQKKADAEREREAAEVKNLKGPNAFKVLMSGNKEDEEWKVTEIDLKRDGKQSVGNRKAPFYKVMTGIPMAVDAFRYGSIPVIKAYFLTHAHSDYYTNLSGSWKHGPIYCSESTANLIKLMLGVDAQWVHGSPWDTPFELPDTGGVKVTVIKANHCPGSSLFLFEGKQAINAGDSTIRSPYIGGSRTWRYLHCGDFRACPEMILHPAIKDKKIDVCYLDTTYLNPQYCFPPQPLVIQACANRARRTVLGIGAPDAPEMKMDKGEEPDDQPYLKGQADANMQEKGKRVMQDWLVKQEEEVAAEGKAESVEKKPRGRTLVTLGTFSIGKERIVKGVARALNSKIYSD